MIIIGGILPNTSAIESKKISLSYREKIALPSNSTAKLFLIDQNNDQTEKLIIKEEAKEIKGQIPVDFIWDLSDIKSDKDYLIQAIIKSEDGSMLWFSSKILKDNIMNKEESLDIILTRAKNEKKIFESRRENIELRYLDNMVQVFIDEKEFILHQQRSASGAKYVSEELMLWNKGKELFVEYGGENFKAEMIE